MIKIGLIAMFWAITAVACLRPSPRMRAMFLATFFGMMIVCGLGHRPAWPFFGWDMWSHMAPPSLEWTEIMLVDAAGREWRYDFAAVPPACPTIIERKCGAILLDRPDEARMLAQWLLERARALRESPAKISPRWWCTTPGLLPVGPAPRESCAGWASEATACPGEFVALIVKKKRVHFSTPTSAPTQDNVFEKRFSWTGS